MRGDAEGNARNFPHKHRGVCRAICEVHVHVLDAAARKQFRKIKRVARSLLCLKGGTVFFFMRSHQRPGPLSGAFGGSRSDLQDFLRRRIMNRGAQACQILMAQTGQRRINGADHQVEPQPLQRQHFGVAKRLRNNRITRVKITKAHSLRLRIARGPTLLQIPCGSLELRRWIEQMFHIAI